MNKAGRIILSDVIIYYRTECVGHICNPSYAGGRDGRIAILYQSGQKVCSALSQKQARSGDVHL
jgi:hypothetical protein